MYHVYILCDEPDGQLYVGFTNDVFRRQWEHVRGERSRYAHQRRIFWLVHVETFGDYKQAVRREKAIKGWSRKRKIALIERYNPKWRVYEPA